MKNIFKFIFIFVFFLISISANAFEIDFVQLKDNNQNFFVEAIKYDNAFEIKHNNIAFILSNLKNERISQCNNLKNNQNYSSDNINNQNKNNNLTFNFYADDSSLKFINNRACQIENTIYARAP